MTIPDGIAAARALCHNQRTVATKRHLLNRVIRISGPPLNETEAADLIRTTRENRNMSLDLSFEGLQEVPPEVFELTWLQSLKLNGNALTNIPSDISLLADLRILDLGANEDLQLCDAIGELSRLERLNLTESRQRSLPGWLSSLHNLQRLYEAYAKLSLKKYRPMAVRNEVKKVFSGLL